MAAYRWVYDSRHLQADCQEPGSAAEPYARQSSIDDLFYVLHYFYVMCSFKLALSSYSALLCCCKSEIVGCQDSEEGLDDDGTGDEEDEDDEEAAAAGTIDKFTL